MSVDRIPCIVPFCRRTAPAAKYPPDTRIICGKHWQRTPKAYRRAYNRAMRRWNRGNPDAMRPVMYRLWDRMARAAVEAAGGLA